MKIAPAEADAFCAAPPAPLKAALLYGHEAGLIKERGAALLKSWTGGDTSGVVELPLGKIKDDAGLLGYELYSTALFGGTRIVVIPDGADSLTKPLKEHVAALDNMNARLLVYGQGLTSKSSLKTLFEAAPGAAAMACYADEAPQAAKIVAAMLHDAGLKAPPPVLQALGLSLAGDRLLLRRALEKLIVYVYPAAEVTLKDVAAVLPADIDDAEEEDMLRWLSGDGAAAEAVANVSPAEIIGRLRLVLRLILRLYTARLYTEEGVPVKAALLKLTPPVFFKAEALYTKVLAQTASVFFERWITRLMDVERLAKKDNRLAEARWRRLVHAA